MVFIFLQYCVLKLSLGLVFCLEIEVYCQYMKEKLREFIRFRVLKSWYEKYERILLPFMLIFGIATDMLAFTRLDTGLVFYMLGLYLLLSGAIILFVNGYEQKLYLSENRILKYARLLSPLFIQFLFGALLNGVFIFYFFSGTLFVSWPFLLVIVFLMISNDVFRKYYLKPLVQVTVYFFILFSYFSVIFPFIFNSLSRILFLVAGLSSLCIISIFILVLAHLRAKVRLEYINFVLAVFVVFATVNGLYFFNLIPPIPLSIREVALSHGIVRNGSMYTLYIQESSWWQRFFSHESFFLAEGENISLYTAIFAPKNFQSKIVHHWQMYDTVKKQWVSKDRLSFALSGGRNGGFRGYSTKNNVPFGAWRVDVETDRGQVLGRVRFDVVPAPQKVETTEILK